MVFLNYNKFTMNFFSPAGGFSFFSPPPAEGRFLRSRMPVTCLEADRSYRAGQATCLAPAGVLREAWGVAARRRST